MGATVALGNVVGEAEDAFLEAIIPLHGHFYANAVITGYVEMEDFVDGDLVLIKVLYKSLQTTVVSKVIYFACTFVG